MFSIFIFIWIENYSKKIYSYFFSDYFFFGSQSFDRTMCLDFHVEVYNNSPCQSKQT